MGNLLGLLLTLVVGMLVASYLLSKGVSIVIVLILAFFIGYAGRKVYDGLGR